jgi:serine/threonine protein kinase
MLTDVKVALKEIRSTHDNDQHTWDREASTLERVNKLDHNHIIKGIAAIARGDRRYLMFPWADGGTLSDVWHRIPQPTLSSGLLRSCVVQLRGLADALAHMHEYRVDEDEQLPRLPISAEQESPSRPKASFRHGDLKPTNILISFPRPNDLESPSQPKASIRHGDLKPANILSFSPRSNDLGLLKFADLATAKRHVNTTELRLQTTTRYGTRRYEAPETLTARRGLSRLYDLWSMGCITFEMITWLLYGQNGLRLFDDEVGTATPGDHQFYEVFNTSGETKVSEHRVVRRWMDYIEERDPECRNASAIRDLLAIVREKLLVIELPPSVAKNVATAAQFHDVSSSDVLRPRYRSTALAFRDALDAILANDISSEYWLIHPDRTGVVSPHKEKTYLEPLLSKSAAMLVTPPAPKVKLMQEHLADASLNDPIDNTFAQEVLHYRKPELLGKNPADLQASELCEICKYLNFFSERFTYEWKPSDVALRANKCAFCRLILKISPSQGQDMCLLERSGPHLKLAHNDAPSLTIVDRPLSETSEMGQSVLAELPKRGSDAFYAALRLWLATCDTTHPDCHSRTPGDLPTRLIDVNDLRLVETKRAIIWGRDYCALSFCWGPDPVLGTSTANIDQFHRSIPLDTLSATMRDAILCTRSLGIRYLYIDALCIVQDDHTDRRREIERIADAYGNAFCVLAASNASTASEGFLSPRPQIDAVAFQRVTGPDFHVRDFIDDYDREVLSSLLYQRGWVFQEHVLARRTIHFGKTQTYLECGEGIQCEFPSSTTR